MASTGPRRPARCRRPQNHHAARLQAARLQSERLEPRLALAADMNVTLVDGVVRIDGTAGDDAILVHQAGSSIAVDYSSGINTIGRLTFPTGARKLEVFGGDGRDLIVLRVGSLPNGIVVDAGPAADLVIAQGPVELRDLSGLDRLVPIVDPTLAAGIATTTRRTETPSLAHEATYFGQALEASRTWTSDGRFVEVTVDPDGRTFRDTFHGGHLALQETWDLSGAHQRVVNDLDGTVLRETFQDGIIRLEERQHGRQVTRTAWEVNGRTVRQSIDGDALLLEEAWDDTGGHRRSWGDDAGRTFEEVFEEGVLRLKTVTTGRRLVRVARDTSGNRVREVLLDDVLLWREQWDTAGMRRVTRFEAGSPASRETFEQDRMVQQELWADGRLVRTAWNASGERIVQTLVGDTKIREEEIRATGERRATEWVGVQTIRTTTDTAGNMSVERSAEGRLLSRELRSAEGNMVRTTFDAAGQVTSEERATADGRQIQRTIWVPGEAVRLTLRDGVVVQRERWRDGGMRRTTDDGSGTVRVERFADSDLATLAEGTRVSDTVTTTGGEQLRTIWSTDGTRRFTATKNGTLVFEESLEDGVLTKIVYGSDGSGQMERFQDNQRFLYHSLADGTWRAQHFTLQGDLLYEYLLAPNGSSQESTFSRSGAYGAGVAVTTLVMAGSGPNDVRMRTRSETGFEQRHVWRGYGELPGSGSTYLEQSDYSLDWLGNPLGPNDVRQETLFFDAGRLVFHQQTRGNGSTSVLTSRPSAAWDQARAGSYFGLSGGNVFSLVPGGGSFNLGYIDSVLRPVIAPAVGVANGVVQAVETSFKPLEQAIGNARTIFSGIQSVSRAMDVNFRTLQGDLGKIFGSIDFGRIALPNFEAVRFDGIDFGKVFAFKWQPLDVEFTNPFAAIDFGGILETAGDVRDFFGEKLDVFSDWLAKVDPFAAIHREVTPRLEQKVELRSRGWRYIEAGYTQDQAELLYDLLDRTRFETLPPGFYGRYLQEFNAFLAEEGKKVYQAHLDRDGGELDAAGHAGLRQAASQAAQVRLLARYGLNPDGTRMPPSSNNPGLGLGDVAPYDENDARFNPHGPNGYEQWTFGPESIGAEPRRRTNDERQKPKSDEDQEREAERQAREQARRQEEAQQRRQRIESTRREVREKLPGAMTNAAGEKLEQYARAKGKEVAEFHDGIEQTLRIGSEFAAGLGEGAKAAVEGLAKSVVAALDADTWRGLAAIVREKGRNFMAADDKARFVADLGEQAYKSLEDTVVTSIAEWERASPEARARMLGRLAGQIATDSVLTGVMGKIAGRAIDATKIGRKTKAAIDRITGSSEFPAYERSVKDAAGPDKTNVTSLLEGHKNATGKTFAEQLRKEAGMDVEHARRIAQFAKDRKQLVIVRATNPNSLQYHGRKGFSAKPVDLKLKTNEKTGLVTATRRSDGALIDAKGKVVDGMKVDGQGWIVDTTQLTNGKPTRTNYRLNKGHVVDAKGTKFFGDYDLLSIDEEPLNGLDWQHVPTGSPNTGSGQIVHALNRFIWGSDESRYMFKHGAVRDWWARKPDGSYVVAPGLDAGDTFVVFDSNGTVFVSDRLYVKRLLDGRNIPADDVIPPLDPLF